MNTDSPQMKGDMLELFFFINYEKRYGCWENEGLTGANDKYSSVKH